MEAAHTLPFFATRSSGDEVLIDGLRVGDETLLRLVREAEAAAENPDRLVRDALEIGSRVLDREQTGIQADYVKAEFERTARELDREFVERARLVAERLDKRIDEAFGAESGVVTKALERHFGDESSVAVQNRVREVVTTVAGQMREDLRKQFTSDSENNPLAGFQRAALGAMKQNADQQTQQLLAVTEKLEAMKLEIAHLRAEREQAIAVAAEAERGTAKGRPYEDAVAEAIEAIAIARGDDAEAVGDMRGEGGRKGDVVVGVEGATGVARAHIVFEAKNSRMSRPEALKYLDAARLTRNADYAVLVVPSEDKLPAKTVQLREFNGDKLFVVFDAEDGSRTALEVAYSLARARVLMNRSESAGVDCDAVRAEVERAVSAMGSLTQVKRQLSNAHADIDKAQEIIETMAAIVQGHLGQIDSLLDAAGDAS